MKYVLGNWKCETCGSNKIAPISKSLRCEICADGMRRRPGRARMGEILRRWTADAASSVGGQVRARDAFEDPLVADVRRLRLQLVAVAAKLAPARVTRAR